MCSAGIVFNLDTGQVVWLFAVSARQCIDLYMYKGHYVVVYIHKVAVNQVVWSFAVSARQCIDLYMYEDTMWLFIVFISDGSIQ